MQAVFPEKTIFKFTASKLSLAFFYGLPDFICDPRITPVNRPQKLRLLRLVFFDRLLLCGRLGDHWLPSLQNY